MNKTTVITHSADYDGIFSREIARHFLGNDNVTYIGWDYGDPKIRFPDEGKVYVIDLNPECLTHTPQRAASDLIWIDHHKTAIEKWPAQIIGYRIDGVAACRLAWQWFTMEQRLKQHGSTDADWWGKYPLPEVEDFKRRQVLEPLAVRLAGEYDVWDKRDPRAETFQYGLRADSNPDEVIRRLLENDPVVTVDRVLDMGYIAQLYARHTDASLVKHRSFEMKWEGLTFLCLNTARCNSLTFAAAVKPDHDGLLGFYWNGQKWTISLYGVEHRKDVDLSEIAKRYGGGGHPQACGFQCEKLPFDFYKV